MMTGLDDSSLMIVNFPLAPGISQIVICISTLKTDGY